MKWSRENYKKISIYTKDEWMQIRMMLRRSELHVATLQLGCYLLTIEKLLVFSMYSRDVNVTDKCRR